MSTKHGPEGIERQCCICLKVLSCLSVRVAPVVALHEMEVSIGVKHISQLLA